MKSLKIFILLLCLPFISFTQQTINGTILHDNILREYILYVPASYNPNNAVPLIFCFHGYGSNANTNYAYTNFRTIADTAGFIVAHPQGTIDNNGSTHWNVGGWTIGSTIDDVGFADALLDTISSNYNINSERVYSTGMSNGGYMSFLIACQLSNRFAAVASVTGSMTPQTFSACNPQHPTPIMQIHGTADGTVPYTGDPLWTLSIADVLQYWMNYNNCNPTPTTTQIPDINTSDGSTVEYIVYSGGTNGVTTEHFKVIGGDHDWPDVWGNQDINSSIEIWKFFSKYDINGAINPTTIEPIVDNEFSIYPIPASNSIYVSSNFKNETSYEILSLNGRVIKKGIISSTNVSIDVSKLASATYYFKVANKTKKMIIIK
jgi:polyhydroxybutyrate depolymerase